MVRVKISPQLFKIHLSLLVKTSRILRFKNETYQGCMCAMPECMWSFGALTLSSPNIIRRVRNFNFSERRPDPIPSTRQWDRRPSEWTKLARYERLGRPQREVKSDNERNRIDHKLMRKSITRSKKSNFSKRKHKIVKYMFSCCGETPNCCGSSWIANLLEH